MKKKWNRFKLDAVLLGPEYLGATARIGIIVFEIKGYDHRRNSYLKGNRGKD